MIDKEIFSEPEMLKRLKAGDEGAFTAIYEQYWEKLYFIAHRHLSSPSDAKEIVQEVFLSLWHKKEKLDIQSLPLYLGAMARYAVYRHLGKEKKAAAHLYSIQSKGAEQSVAAFDIENRQLLEILNKLANELPEKCRLIFIHHKLLDEPLDEVARRLGISPRTAEDYVTRAMKVMRKHREGLAQILLLLLP